MRMLTQLLPPGQAIRLIILGLFLSFFPLQYSGVVLQSQSYNFSTAQNNFVFNPLLTRSTIRPSVPSGLVTIGFWGDFMLARNVERLTTAMGEEYPYQQIRPLFLENTYNIINFEGAVPTIHRVTPFMGMQFSVAEQKLGALRTLGVTHVSLANNHALDFGQSGYTMTKSKLDTAALLAFGHPTLVDTNSAIYLDLDTYRVAVLALHTVYGDPSDSSLAKVFSALSAQSDIQIVFVHWGTEYTDTHTPSQERFAKKLIALGADAIIGSHPHVAQDIQVYDTVPVFYSLGNVVFDQYFSTAVQQGYGISFSVASGKLQFVLSPITSLATHSQPVPMSIGEQTLFLNMLARKSATELMNEIMESKLIFPFYLATST